MQELSASPAARIPFEPLICLAIALPLCLAPLAGHVDDVDAQGYLVIARNIARTGRWLDPGFLPAVWPHFREHLPFGFWPAAAAMRLAGEWAVPFLYAAFSVGAVAASSRLARAIAGPAAALAAGVSLALCESIWHYSARLLLDPPLLLLTTLSCLAWCQGRRPRAAIWAALAVLVKGPYGLLPLLAVGGATLLLDRSARSARHLALVCMAALAPAFAFLVADRVWGDGSWWRGYLLDQVHASLAGERRDGVTGPFYPLRVIAGRFWPGLPFALLGGIMAVRDGKPAERKIALACLLGLAAISLPTRKWGNHMYVLFPLLAVLAGIGAKTLLERWERFLPRAGGAIAVAALLFALAGGGRLVLQPPCDFSTALASRLQRVGPRIVLVRGDFLALAELAAESGLEVWPAETPDTLLPAAVPLSYALPARFVETARGRAWKLLEPVGR